MKFPKDIWGPAWFNTPCSRKGLQCEQQPAAGELERMLLWKLRRAGELLHKQLRAFQKQTDHQHPPPNKPNKTPTPWERCYSPRLEGRQFLSPAREIMIINLNEREHTRPCFTNGENDTVAGENYSPHPGEKRLLFLASGSRPGSQQ